MKGMLKVAYDAYKESFGLAISCLKTHLDKSDRIQMEPEFVALLNEWRDAYTASLTNDDAYETVSTLVAKIKLYIDILNEISAVPVEKWRDVYTSSLTNDDACETVRTLDAKINRFIYILNDIRYPSLMKAPARKAPARKAACE